jgi:carbon monoxide dehydrogenase subunit G
LAVAIYEAALIRARPERIWDVLIDWERQASWMPDVAWIRVVGPDRALGTRLAVKTKVFGVPLTTDLIRVTVWEPPRRLGVRHEGVVKGRGEWRLLPEASHRLTRFTWIEEISLPPGRLGDAAFGVYAPVQRRMLRRSIRNLRGLVEG